MQDSTNPNQQLVGTQLQCTQTNTTATITEYADDFWTGTERFEGFRVLYPSGVTHVIHVDRVGRDYLPHSFVLADLFDVEAMFLDIPDEVYELDPTIGFVPCPDCDGQGWYEVEGSAWENPAWRFHKFSSLKPCLTCNCEGQVLAALEPIQDIEDLPTPNNQIWLLAA
jgi:hypothetical protein